MVSSPTVKTQRCASGARCAESDARAKRVLADSSVRQQQDGKARLAFNRACKLIDSQATVTVVAARDVNGKIVFDSARYNVVSNRFLYRCDGARCWIDKNIFELYLLKKV